MEFFNHIHCQYAGVKGFVKFYTDALRYRYVITQKAFNLLSYLPKTPKMNGYVERFNRNIQEEFIDYFGYLLINPDDSSRKLVDYLIFYDTKRVHCTFQNKMSPLQFMLSLSVNQLAEKCKIEWHYISYCY